MPYALVAAGGRLFAGFSDGQLWESSDRGDTWCPCVVTGEKVERLHALCLVSD